MISWLVTHYPADYANIAVCCAGTIQGAWWGRGEIKRAIRESSNSASDMDGTRLRFGFLNNHHRLLFRLSTSSVLPFVYSAGLVSDTEKALIQHEISESQKTDKLLDIIHRQGNTNPKIYQDFFNLLSDDSVTGGQSFESVLKKIEEDSQSQEVERKFDYGRRLLEEDDRAAILKHKWTVVQSLSVDELLPQLISFGVVSLKEKDEIK